MDTYSAPVFSDERKARRYLERLRWPRGPLCPQCGGVDHAYEIQPAGVYRCANPGCHANFTVTVNTVMERSHIALHKWLRAFHMMCASKNGVSAHQLHKTLEITYRSAWFMVQRIRQAMIAGGIEPSGAVSRPQNEAQSDPSGRRPRRRATKRAANAGKRATRKSP